MISPLLLGPIYFVSIACLSANTAFARCVRVEVPSLGHEVGELSFPFRSTFPRVYHETIPPHRTTKEQYTIVLLAIKCKSR